MAWLLLTLGLVAQSAIAFSSIQHNGAGSHYSRVANTQLKSSSLTNINIPTQSSTQQPIERVAIVGAGIAGLSLAHALRSTNLMNDDDVNTKPIQIDIFDSRQKLDEKSGSGIQLTGGIAALRKISPKLQRQVSDASIPLQKVESTCRPWFGSDDTNDSWKILEIDLQRAIKERDIADRERTAKEATAESGGIEKHIEGLMTEDGEILAYTILRGTLQRIMQTELSSEHNINVQFDKRLCDISNKEGEGGITCQFTDGTQSSGYDLIIGCDGIQSAVRQYVNTGSIQAKNKEAAIYSGLRITFAIQEDAKDADDVCTFKQHFGNGAYALTSTYGAGKDKSRAKGAFLVYPDENYIGPFKRQKPDEDSIGTLKTTSTDEAEPLDENVNWTQSKRIPKDKIQECLKILQTSSIPGNDVARIVENSDRFFDLGVYFYNPFIWNGWVREILTGSGKDINPKFAVLTGDAAHAMPPFLGQGANQAMQDSCSLAAKIFEYNSQISTSSSSEPDLKALLKEYENRRWLPTTSITAKAALLGYLEVGPSLFSNFRDVFFLVMGKIGVAKKVFLDSAFPKM